jgi:hypothetical protein
MWANKVDKARPIFGGCFIKILRPKNVKAARDQNRMALPHIGLVWIGLGVSRFSTPKSGEKSGTISILCRETLVKDWEFSSYFILLSELFHMERLFPLRLYFAVHDLDLLSTKLRLDVKISFV